MTRRFQFSLRALLGITALLCLWLGGLRLFETYGQKLDVVDLAVGKPIKVHARYVRPFGPQECVVFVESSGSATDWCLCQVMARRSWLGVYRLECEAPLPGLRPGELRLTMGELTSRHGRIKRVAKRKTIEVP